MSIKKKIALGFFLSALIIAILAVSQYLDFIEIKKEIRFLEITDTIRSKSLQLRRHEKNFFLYPLKAAEELQAIHTYLDEIDAILRDSRKADRNGTLSHLEEHMREYRQLFNEIESSITSLSNQFMGIRNSNPAYRRFSPLIELTLREHPVETAIFLKEAYYLPDGHPLITGLRKAGTEINALRKSGEDILVHSKELDKIAREKAERTIHLSQIAILIFFPLFFVTGIVTLFFISRNVVNRLNLLINVVEKTGKGDYEHIPVPLQTDEVGVLIQKFNNMEDQLSLREAELNSTNKELLQSKKLAAIGTLASGVAHELNNPLNNIYISAQVLEKEVSDSCSPMVIETLNDILSQTVRVKRIVGDLLDFARGREPVFKEVELKELIMGAYKFVSTAINTEGINLSMDTGPDILILFADPEQLERVFINIFINAIDAMSGAGDLSVNALKNGETINVKISDTGKGIPAEAIDKVFEPFYTTKDKGTGLGLAIVFNIIKKHGGDIVAESKEGKGTTFTITLPVKKGIA